MLSSRRVIETRTRVYLNRHVSWIAFKSACMRACVRVRTREHVQARESTTTRRHFETFGLSTTTHHDDDDDDDRFHRNSTRQRQRNEPRVLKVVQFARGSTFVLPCTFPPRQFPAKDSFAPQSDDYRRRRRPSAS